MKFILVFDEADLQSALEEYANNVLNITRKPGQTYTLGRTLDLEENNTISLEIEEKQ